MKKQLLVTVDRGETRVAILESEGSPSGNNRGRAKQKSDDWRVAELYIERRGSRSIVGNIYKGRIVNLEPSIQAAFVDFGVGRNGFLHISDVEPQYFRQGGFDPGESMGLGRMADIDVGDDELRSVRIHGRSGLHAARHSYRRSRRSRKST